MKKTLIAISLLTMPLFANASDMSEQPERRMEHRHSEKIFEKMDANKDGVISKSEWHEAHKRMKEKRSKHKEKRNDVRLDRHDRHKPSN